MSADIRVNIRWYKPSEGGRQSIPVGLDYRATARIGDNEHYWSIKLLMPNTSWPWDEQREVDALFLVREQLQQLIRKGVSIYITEGQRIVAEGFIVAIFPQENDVEDM